MRLKHIKTGGIAVFIAFSLHSCSKSSYSGTPAVTPPTMSVLLKADSKFGNILTNPDGASLYFFGVDANGASGCNGTCATIWLPFYTADTTNVGTGLNAADFRTITRSDGSKQTTYKGWPLYTFSGDGTSGGGYGGTPVIHTVSGDGFAGIWFVAKPDYTVMIVKAQLLGDDGVMYDSTYIPKTEPTVYMTDDRGVTLYSFSFDSSANNNYTAADFSNNDFWPIVQISTVQNVPSVLDKADFSSITVDGKPQLTYKGWPVYQFGPDGMIRGNNKGISVPHPGIWPVMDQFSPEAPHL